MFLQPGIALLAVCNLPPIDGPPDTGPVDAPVIQVSNLPAEPVSYPVKFGGDVDSDGDGIPDDAERSGVASEPLLDMPAYGANPEVPDIFVQADWLSCDPITEFCGVNNSLDFYQVSSRVAAEWAAMYQPDFAIHVDNGLDPTDPALASVHGAWGGARRVHSSECNPDVLGARYGYFHRGVHRGYNGGGSGRIGGYCFAADSGHGAVSAHELGHNLGLGHGGTLASFGVNCKPHYRSPMNYGYLYDRSVTAFSRNERDFAMNGEYLDERPGAGLFDEVERASLENYVWDYQVREDGAIDWNRNGVFEDGTVRGALTWASASCEQSFIQFSQLPRVEQPTLAWLPGMGGQTARMYLLGRDEETDRPSYRWATRFDDCDLSDLLATCTHWQPDETDPARAIPGALAGKSALAGTSWTDGGVSYLAVVYSDQQGLLHRQTMHLDTDGAEVWSEPVAIAGGAAITDGSPAIAHWPENSPLDGQVVVIAPDGPRLLAYHGEVQADGHLLFSGPAVQRWDDGTPILPCYGVALTRGYQADIADEGLYALIPAGPMCELEFARWQPDGPDGGQDGEWVRMTDTLWGDTPRPLVDERPGLAYVPFSNHDASDPDGELIADVTVGRFYLAFMRQPESPAIIYLTEGNDPRAEAESHRMVLIAGAYIRNVWAMVDGGVTLMYDHRHDRNLRAVWSRPTNQTFFNPYADGIVDIDMYDVDDYAVMREHIACSLTESCP